MSTGEILTLLVSAAVSYTAFLFASAISKRIKASQASNTKKLKLGRTTLNVVSIAALWFFLTKLITSLFGVHPEKLSVEIFAPKAEVFGFSISTSVVSAWIVVAIIILLAVLFRVLCVPRFKDKPKGLQNVMELAVEAVSGYARTTSTVWATTWERTYSRLQCFSSDVQQLSCSAPGHRLQTW